MILAAPAQVVCKLGDTTAPMVQRVKDPSVPAGWAEIVQELPPGWTDLGNDQHLCATQDAVHAAAAKAGAVTATRSPTSSVE